MKRGGYGGGGGESGGLMVVVSEVEAMVGGEKWRRR